MSKADEIFAQNCRKHMISGREIWVRRDDAMLAIEQAQREAIEEAAKLVEGGKFDVNVRLDPARHKNLSDWFREQEAAAIRKLAPHREGQ